LLRKPIPAAPNQGVRAFFEGRIPDYERFIVHLTNRSGIVRLTILEGKLIEYGIDTRIARGMANR